VRGVGTRDDLASKQPARAAPCVTPWNALLSGLESQFGSQKDTGENTGDPRQQSAAIDSSGKERGARINTGFGALKR
jgi:hypothetical protein